MKIKPEDLKKIKTCYHLKSAIAVEDCTSQEQAEICDYILSDKELLSSLTPHIGGLQDSILGWAEKNLLLQSEQHKIIILELVDKLHAEKQEAARIVAAENALTLVREKLATRWNARRFSMKDNDPTRTALHDIVGMSDPRNTDLQRALALLQNNASLEARDKDGETPLISAAIEGNNMMTLLLLSRGANAAVADNDGYTPKLFKLFYSCDHEYDQGGCILLKKYIDNPMRIFLGKLEDLEKINLADGKKCYALENIKVQLLSILNDKDLQDSKPLAALCGYLFHHVAEHEQHALCQFFKSNCKIDIMKEIDLVSTFMTTYGGPQAAIRRSEITTLIATRHQRHRLFANSAVAAASSGNDKDAGAANLQRK